MQEKEIGCVADNICTVLDARGLSRADLARMSGLSTAIVSQVVTGATKDPRLTTLVALARALEVSLDYLVFGPQPTAVYSDVMQEHLNENYAILDYHGRCRLYEESDILVRLHRLDELA